KQEGEDLDTKKVGMSEASQTSTSKEAQIEISVPEKQTPSESSTSQISFYRILQSLIDLVRPSSENPEQSISIADDEWVQQGIIVIPVEPLRELHLLSEEDQKLFEQMKTWVADYPEKGLIECVEEFGDALAKVLYNYQFPDFIITYRIDTNDKHLKEKGIKRKNFEKLLLKARLVVEHERDGVSDTVYMKLFAPFQKLCEQAEIQKTVLYKGNQILAKRQVTALSIGNLIKNDVFLSYFPIHDGPYTHDKAVNVEKLVEQSFYGEPTYKISDDDRKPILESVNDKDDGEKPASDRKHNVEVNKRAWLYDNWVSSIGRQPLEEIREYFGEKMALYFAWLALRKSPITMKQEIHFPLKQRLQKLAVSGVVVFVSVSDNFVSWVTFE
ncbi:2962_t:CDS:2, partial [Racocetra fulgida]